MGSKKEPAAISAGGEARRERNSGEDRPGIDRENTDGSGASGALPDLLRRAMALGLSGFFSTEEALRRALGDTLPQDWVDFATAQSDRTRTELMARMSEEMGRVLEKVELVEVFERLLEGRTIEINAQIRLGERSKPREPDSSGGDRNGVTELRVDLTTHEKSGK